MPIYQNPKTGEEYELDFDYDVETGIDRNREKALKKGYKPLQEVVNPKTKQSYSIPEQDLDKAIVKGYQIPELAQANEIPEKEELQFLTKLKNIPEGIAQTASDATTYFGKSMRGEIPLSEQLSRIGTAARGTFDVAASIGDLPAKGIAALIGAEYKGSGAKPTQEVLGLLGADKQKLAQQDVDYSGARLIGESIPLAAAPATIPGIGLGAAVQSYASQMADTGKVSGQELAEDVALGGIFGAGATGVSKLLNAPMAAKDVIKQRLMQKGEGVGAKFVEKPEALAEALNAPSRAAKLQSEIASLDVEAMPKLNELSSNITTLKNDLANINKQIEDLNFNKQELTLADKQTLNILNVEKQLKTDQLLEANKAIMKEEVERGALEAKLGALKQEKASVRTQKQEAVLANREMRDEILKTIREKSIDMKLERIGQKDILNDLKAGKIKEVNEKLSNAWQANQDELAAKSAKVDELIKEVPGFVPTSVLSDLDNFYAAIRDTKTMPLDKVAIDKLIADLKPYIGRDEISVMPANEFLKNVKNIKSILQQRYYDIQNPKLDSAGKQIVANRAKILFENVAEKLGAEEAAAINSSMKLNYDKASTLKNFGKIIRVDQRKVFAPSANRLESATSPELLQAASELNLQPSIKTAVANKKQELFKTLQQKEQEFNTINQQAFDQLTSFNKQQRELERRLLELTKEENKINGQLPVKNLTEARAIKEQLKELNNQIAKIQSQTTTNLLPIDTKTLELQRQAQTAKNPLKELIQERAKLKNTIEAKKIPLISQKHAENLKSLDINQLKGVDLQDRGIIDAVTSNGIVPQLSKGLIRELINPVRQIQAYNALTQNVGVKAVNEMLQSGRTIATGTGKALSSYTAISPNDDWNIIKNPSADVPPPLASAIKALANTGKPFTMDVITALAKQHKVDPKIIIAYIGQK